MRITEHISSSPITPEKSVRAEEIRALTSCRAGKIIPVSYIPMLREDRVSRGSIKLAFEMSETVFPLMNAINVTAFAHYIPFSAFERFPGMDSFNRSYQGEGEPHNDVPIQFFPPVNFKRSHAFWKTLGVHWPEDTPINRAPLEAYNLLVNFRRKTRSGHLPLRDLDDRSLAEAFWRNPNMWHVVPDFDQAAMDGEVELQWTDPRLYVSGIGHRLGNAAMPTLSDVEVHERAARGGPKAATYEHAKAMGANNGLAIRTSDNGLPAIYAELQNSGIRLSLANIELAKKTAAFARMRDAYKGLDDDHLIDLLMEGIRIPDEALKQPILLDKKSTIFGYAERHAMDGASLDKSVTTGATEITLNFRTPPMNTGGIILVTVEIVPEQLFERMHDAFLGTTDPDTLPNFMRDYLDPEKVDVVANRHVDVMHSVPDGVFGYAPLNHEWKRSLTRIGGKYYRPNPDTFVEDRQRFWSIEQIDPTLTDDFYLVPTTLPHTVFADTLADPFEILSLGRVQIVGNTVFGKTITEDEGHYDHIMEQVDTKRIDQTKTVVE